MGILSGVFTLIITVVLPVVGAMFLSDRDKSYMRAFGAGIVVYAAAQVLSVLPPLSDMTVIMEPCGDIAAAFVPTLIFAVISELLRFAVIKYYLVRDRTPGDAFALGFGHWGAEALLTVGLTVIVLTFNYSSSAAVIEPTAMVLTGLERLFVLPVMALLALLALKAVKSKGYAPLAAAVALNAALNGLTTYLVRRGVSPFIIVFIMGLAGIACGIGAYRLFTSKDLNK